MQSECVNINLFQFQKHLKTHTVSLRLEKSCLSSYRYSIIFIFALSSSSVLFISRNELHRSSCVSCNLKTIMKPRMTKCEDITQRTVYTVHRCELVTHISFAMDHSSRIRIITFLHLRPRRKLHSACLQPDCHTDQEKKKREREKINKFKKRERATWPAGSNYLHQTVVILQGHDACTAWVFFFFLFLLLLLSPPLPYSTTPTLLQACTR